MAEDDPDWWEPRHHYWPEPVVPEVDIRDPHEIGVILDANGDVLHTVTDRPIIPFGFQPPED